MASSHVDYDEVCFLCQENWNRNGAHEATRLPCGHIYGYRVDNCCEDVPEYIHLYDKCTFSCIKRWVDLRLNCPICKRLTRKCNFKGVFQRTAPSDGDRIVADLEARKERRRIAHAARKAARNRKIREYRLGAFQENVDNQTENEVNENAGATDSRSLPVLKIQDPYQCYRFKIFASAKEYHTSVQNDLRYIY